MQRPQTTILNLIDFGRDIGLGEALVPREAVRAIHAANRALYDDGRLTPEATKNLDWREREWFFPGPVVTGSNVGPSKTVPQGGRVELLTIRAATAPSTGTCTFVLSAGGQTETIALPVGATANASSNVGIVVDPGGVLTLNCLNDGGAANVTVTAFLSAYSGGA